MKIVELSVNGMTYPLQCEEGEEKELHELAQELSKRLGSLDRAYGEKAETLSEQNTRLLITNLMLLGEMRDLRKKTRERTGKDREEIENMIADTLERIASKLEYLGA